jgi:hypothetical protein
MDRARMNRETLSTVPQLFIFVLWSEGETQQSLALRSRYYLARADVCQTREVASFGIMIDALPGAALIPRNINSAVGQCDNQ